PLLSQVAALPPAPPPRPVVAGAAETVTDEPPGRRVPGAGAPGEASETALDPGEPDVVTRRDRGGPEPVTRHDPVGFQGQGHGHGPGFGAGHGQNHGPGHGQGQNQGHGQNHGQGQSHGRGQGGSPYAPPRPGGDPEARTLLETGWAQPPSQPGPVSATLAAVDVKGGGERQRGDH